ncbi:hypothetical protein, partial [Vibrio cholerae]|uniref:hypothetical protein n=1 Tax=Vibrio cholerae TaxID=666 RepID=UPI001F3716B9
ENLMVEIFSDDKVYCYLLKLFARMGWEVGKIKRTLIKNDINWGFFKDHGDVFHNNAHLNNFVVLPPINGPNLLGPLDFDLAFTKKDFIN